MNQFDFESIAQYDDSEDLNVLSNDPAFAELSLLFPNVNSILIPKKSEYVLKKYVSKRVLKQIDPDPFIAVEKCLVFLSNLATTVYSESKWKSLYSPLLHEQTKGKDNTYVYKKIVNLLVEGTKNGPLLEVNNRYHDGQSIKYKLGDAYLKAGLTEYVLKTPKIIHVRNQLYYKKLRQALTNPITMNLIKIYPKLELPTCEELLAIGKNLAKSGHHTKKGKKLTVRNKHQNHYWADYADRSFVEDNIKLFEFLTGRGFMIPVEGDEASGGRVVDSFVLMPSWIREQIKIDGVALVEADFVAFHPNIAMSLYGGQSEFLNHQKVAEVLGKNVKEVKVEHLSFFNKKIGQMRKSLLYDYYETNEPDALQNIESDKRTNGYKITSRKLFKVEVDIMTHAIQRLNCENIEVLYVYDALLCEARNIDRVREVMNDSAIEFGVKTQVKKTGHKVEMAILPSQKYRVDDEVDLYQILPSLGWDVGESMAIIFDLNGSRIQMKDLVTYIGRCSKAQRYNDYTGVAITQTCIDKLKCMIAA